MGIIAIGAGLPILAALLYARFDSQTLPIIVGSVVMGPMVACVLMIALKAFVSWGADCHAFRAQLECGNFFGLFPVDSEWVSAVGGGYALAIALLWAAGGLVLLFVAGIFYAIVKALT